MILAARIVLAALFAVAGIAKLINLRASRTVVADFGIPKRLAIPLGSALPFAEVTVAVLLMPVRSAWWGGLGALGLLVGFIAVIAVNLAHGRKPDCQCFGQIRSKPIGWPTLARNGLLALCAGLVMRIGPAGQPSVIDVIGDLGAPQALASAVTVIVLAAIAGQTWVIFHLFTQHGRLLLRMDEMEKRLLTAPATEQRLQAPPQHGLALGAAAPAFELPTLAGQSLALDDLHDGKPAVLIFSDPNCGPCTALLPDIARWQHDYAETVRIAVVSRGTVKANREKTKLFAIRAVLLQNDREVAEAYQVNGTPAAVLVRADGTIGSRLVTGADAIDNLMAVVSGVPVPTAAARSGNGRGKPLTIPMTPHLGLPIGDTAPPVRLPDLYGRTVSLADFKGRRTLVLFWNPGCGFCHRILPQLKAWEESPPQDAPSMLVISTGTVEANRAMRLRSLVVLDPSLALARQFHGRGTPSAVLVDADGRIDSPLAVGGPDVLALVGASRVGHRTLDATIERAGPPYASAGEEVRSALR
jgi:peroxiredoxin